MKINYSSPYYLQSFNFKDINMNALTKAHVFKLRRKTDQKFYAKIYT